jgi:negative regulator of flagellin synthesis FlgM
MMPWILFHSTSGLNVKRLMAVLIESRIFGYNRQARSARAGRLLAGLVSGHGGNTNMEVRGLNSAGRMAPVNRPEAITGPVETAPTALASPVDEVEISSVSKLLDDASRTPGIREQRLAQIKSAIEAGTYETPEKLELALNRMLEELKLDQ